MKISEQTKEVRVAVIHKRPTYRGKKRNPIPVAYRPQLRNVPKDPRAHNKKTPRVPTPDTVKDESEGDTQSPILQ